MALSIILFISAVFVTGVMTFGALMIEKHNKEINKTNQKLDLIIAQKKEATI